MAAAQWASRWPAPFPSYLLSVLCSEMGFEEPAGCFALNFLSSSIAPNPDSVAWGEQTLHLVCWDGAGSSDFPGSGSEDGGWQPQALDPLQTRPAMQR